MAVAPLQVAIPERLGVIPQRLVGDGTAAGHQIVVVAAVAAVTTMVTVATVAVAETIVALGARVKIVLRLR